MRAILLVVVVTALFAQPQPPDPWADLRANNPPGLEHSLRLIAAHPFHVGELIQIESNVPGTHVEPGQGPPAEHWQFGGFLLSPATDCGSVQKPCFGMLSGGFGGGGRFPAMEIGQREGPTALDLNQFIPVLPPGHYRASLLLGKLILTDKSSQGTTYGYSNPRQYAVSNSVEFDVIPAIRSWTQQTILSAIATLKTADPQAYEPRRAASDQIRVLGTSAAWRAASDLLPLDESILIQGLAATDQPNWVCDLLQARLSAADQPIPYHYFSTMLQVCTDVHVLRPALPASTQPVQVRISTTPPAAPIAVAPLPPEQQAYFDQLGRYRSALRTKSASALAASLSQRQGEPLAESFNTLLQQIQESRNARPPEPDPAWSAGLTHDFVRLADKINAREHYQLLSLLASTLRSPELIPVLESVMDGWKPNDYYEAPQAALASLYRLDPDKAQSRILKELVREKTWLAITSLNLLPASAVPPMDDALIQALTRVQQPGGWNPPLIMAALAKYATPAAAPRIRAIYESQQQKCQPELMAYFVRVDPDFADRVFHSHLWDMHVDPPQCTLQYFQRTAPLAMGPPLERYMGAYLMHGNVYVKTTAARMLGAHGTKSAQVPLWEAFRYFHEYWKDQRAQLPPYGEGSQLEAALRNAIARGSHSFANEADLRLLESLCISAQCLNDSRQDLEAWQRPPLRLELSSQNGEFRATVAQYSGLDSLSAIEEKLAQFPRGTSFLVNTWGDTQALSSIREVAERQNLILTEPPK